MLSIIICSVKPDLLSQVKNNINKTIGIKYEIIAFDNRVESLGICQVYNLCAKKAIYNNLLFIHEDILFHSNNWGSELITLLDNKDVGLIGMAGAIYKSAEPTPWVALPSKYYRSNAFFDEKNRNKNTYLENQEVVVVDGMFLATRKEIWQKIPFSDQLKGFHMYDIDYSYQIKKNNYKIIVPKNIKVQHLSHGSFDDIWYQESCKWHKKKNYLFF
ncbi:glycosyltransferase [Formosa haliotis]|uniref:glycosyltransferase n=1 Tax=Formosa haliotis TaxID=1555194 RepID=UPI0008259B79|nr:glycosyltransferase [Formosa haliotis]